MAALVLVLWVVTTLGWWAFAFAPLPSAPPPWLQAARDVCFGPMESGLPGPSGFILLVVAPATLLGSIVAIWGWELLASVRRLARSRPGLALFAVLALAIVVEGTWVAAKLETARRVGSADAAPAEPSGGLPPGYPRQTTPAPDFALIDQRGETIALGRLRGRPVVLTFVFAHCRTMCPVLVETLKRASSGTAGSEVLLVTLDPWRDTPGTLPSIARRWDAPSNFHVLSSRRVDDVLRVARAYDVPFERDERTGDVTHAGLVFVIDAEGRLAFTFNNPPVGWVREALHRLDGSDGKAG